MMKSLTLWCYIPIWLPGLPPVMESKHKGEEAGRQQAHVVVVVQAVGRCQSKSVSNLGTNGFDTNQKMGLEWLVRDLQLQRYTCC